MFTVAEGFKQDIPAKILGNPYNLELLKFNQNVKKYTKCSITKEELYRLYNIYKKTGKYNIHIKREWLEDTLNY